MIAIFNVVGIVLAGSLAYAGLVKGELSVSKETKLTGRWARLVGACCLGLVLLLLAGIAWLVMNIERR